MIRWSVNHVSPGGLRIDRFASMSSFLGTLKNTQGDLIPPTVYPHGPLWSGHITAFTPSPTTYAPLPGGGKPAPMSLGTLRRSTLFNTQPLPAKTEPFGQRISLTFEMRAQSQRHAKSDRTVEVVCSNSTPIGRILDQVGTHSPRHTPLTSHVLTGRAPGLCIGRFAGVLSKDTGRVRSLGQADQDWLWADLVRPIASNSTGQHNGRGVSRLKGVLILDKSMSSRF